MRFLISTAVLGLLSLGAIVEAKNDVYTEWVTVYETVNDCSPPSTTVTVCDVCTPCVITAWTQCITSTTTSTYPTSTYCPQPGYYEECDCIIDYPQWIYYDIGCDVEYVCPYQDWYFLETKVVEVFVKVNNLICDTIQEEWNIIIVPTPVVTYIVNPTIIVVNDITIDVTIAPTYITYTTDVTKTETKTITTTVYPSASPTGNVNPDSRHPSMGPSSIPSDIPSAAPSGIPSAAPSGIPSGSQPSIPSTAPGSVAPSAAPSVAPSAAPSTGPDTDPPVSTFKLLANIGGTDAVIMQQSGSLVLTPATDSTTGVSFTLLSSGEMMTADGQYVSLTFTDGEAGEFTYGAKLSKRELMKRAIADGTYYGVFSADGGFGMTIDGEALTIQVCGDGNVLSASVGAMNGCSTIALQSVPVDETPSSSSTPASTPASTGAPSSAAPPTSDPDPTTTGGSEPTTTGGSGPTNTGGSDPTDTGVSEPTNTNGGSQPTNTSGSEPTTTGDSNPTNTGGDPGPTTTGPAYNNGTNSTQARRFARRMRFNYH